MIRQSPSMHLGLIAALAVFVALPPTTAHGQQSCAPLPAPTGTVVHAYPADVGSLSTTVASAASGTTIYLHEGTYDLRHTLRFTASNVTLRSASGNRDSVVIDAAYALAAAEPIAIEASNVTIADLTIMRAYYHPIHISDPEATTIVTGVLIHNVRIVDPGQQAIKVNPAYDGFVDNGTIQCCAIELTDAGRAHVRDDCYTGGIDVHQGWGWTVRRNRFEGFWCASGLSEHAIHFWRGSRDTMVEENVIVDCARGIGFGLGENDEGRTYPDDPYPGVIGTMGHIDGIIRNNFIAASRTELFASEYGFDTGVGLAQAHGAEVLHNTVASTQTPAASSMEWRFTNTDVNVTNNLVTHNFWTRDGATAALVANIDSAPGTWLEDIPSGDLHLTASATAAEDAGVDLGASCATDFDGDSRDSTPDVGGDEARDTIFADGFESGNTTRWSVSAP